MTERWSDGLLNEMRGVGDPPLDSLVEKHLEGADAMAATGQLAGILLGGAEAQARLAPELRHLVGPSREAAERFSLEAIRCGQRLYRQHGPEIHLVLACYSLPAAYAAHRGVQVLRCTGRLLEHPELRLLDTAQILAKMMSPHALEAGHPGVQAARKVRLLHGVMRYRISADVGRPWNPEQREPGSDIPLGVPINQEDLAGTLLVFSYAILDGLQTLGIQVSRRDREAYMDTWRQAGHILGVLPEMIPEDFDDARALMLRIHQRQHGPSQAGRDMTAALLRMVNGFLPFFLDSVPPSLIRFLMREYPEVADYIGVPHHRITEALLPRFVALGSRVDRIMRRNPVLHRAYRTVSWRLINGLIQTMIGSHHEDFHIPHELEREWLGRKARRA